MEKLRLVTFDIYGTLLDWQSHVETAFPGRYRAFLAASAKRQLPDQAVLPYRELLRQVACELEPRMSEQALAVFSGGFGHARPFADARALQHLSRAVMIGCLSNSDHRHLVDAQKSLGVVFDVSLLAEDWGAYKPHAKAWDQAVETVTKRLGINPRSWLHVSAYADFDLTPAKERGVRTCYMPRPGGSTGQEAEAAGCDYAVSDVWQLANLIESINGAPIVYKIRATARTAELAADYVHWIRYEHGPELLASHGCQSFRITRPLEPLDGATNVVECEYMFTTRGAFDAYLAGRAVELRRKGRERFPENDMSYERELRTLTSGYEQRKRQDFQNQT